VRTFTFAELPVMSLYFFDVYEDDLICVDEEGTQHEGDAKAFAHAIDGIRSIVSSAVRHGVFSLAGRVHVRDAAGAVAMVVPFTDAVAQRG
jgi:hypothetical protein